MVAFVVKKIAVAVLLPPGLLVVGLALLAAGLGWRRRRASAGVCAAAAGVLYLVSLPAVAGLLAGWVEVRDWDPTAVARAEAIVLLGGGVVEGVPDLSGVHIPSADMVGRLVDATRLWRRTGLPIVVTSGAIAGRTSDGPVVVRFLVDLGVPETAIVLDDDSLDTADNARLSAIWLDRLGVRRVVLVTSAYHMRRAMWLFERAGVECTPYPSGRLGAMGSRGHWRGLLPSGEALAANSRILKEILGLLYYAVFGPA